LYIDYNLIPLDFDVLLRHIYSYVTGNWSVSLTHFKLHCYRIRVGLGIPQITQARPWVSHRSFLSAHFFNYTRFSESN